MDDGGSLQVLENPIARNGLIVGLIAALWLTVTSVDSVPPLHYGIRYNNYNKYVETGYVYGPGRYFTGPWNDLMLFPASIQTVEFTNEVMLRQLGTRYEPLHTRTKEGLALHMKVSVQYKLTKDSVGSLYKEFSHDYESFFVSQMRNTLIKVAADFEAPDFWAKREEIGAQMQKALSDTLSRTYADCWGLQLMNIELPPEYDAAIVSTQVVQQNIATQEFAQVATQIRAQTKVIEAEYDRKVKIIKAHGIANMTLAIKSAKAKARSTVLDTDTNIMSQVKTRLKLNAPSLVEYNEYSAVAMLKNATLFFGFEDASGLIMQPTPAKAPARMLSADTPAAQPKPKAEEL